MTGEPVKQTVIDRQTAMSLGVFLTLFAMAGGGLYWAGGQSNRLDTVVDEIKKIDAVQIEKRLTRMETNLERVLTFQKTTMPETWRPTQWSQSGRWLEDPWPQPNATGLTTR